MIQAKGFIQHGIALLHDEIVRALTDLREFDVPLVGQSEVEHAQFHPRELGSLRVSLLVEQLDGIGLVGIVAIENLPFGYRHR